VASTVHNNHSAADKDDGECRRMSRETFLCGSVCTSARHHTSRCHMERGHVRWGTPPTGDPQEGRTPQRTHHRRGGLHRGPTQNTHRQLPPIRSSSVALTCTALWPIQDIVSFLGFCPRINTILYAPTPCLGTPSPLVIAYTIAQCNVPPRPPVITLLQYIPYYIGNGNIV